MIGMSNRGMKKIINCSIPILLDLFLTLVVNPLPVENRLSAMHHVPSFR